MGSLLLAQCPCGYTSKGIMYGTGMMLLPDGRSPWYEPGICRKCREVVSVATHKDRLKCTRCGCKPEVVEISRDNSRGILESAQDPPPESIEQQYECPHCNSLTLVLLDCGCWD
jgi:hypothetical protein